MKILVGALLFSVGFLAVAQVELAPIFTDNMVLQREMRVPVWGKAKPSEIVTVQFDKQTLTATANSEGKWQVELTPLAANKTPQKLIAKSDENTVEISNVLVGEVWLCSGQSNMEMPLCGNNPRFRQTDGEEVAKNAANSNLRIVRMIPYSWSEAPRDDFKMEWMVVDAENVRPVSATAYFFGKNIQESLDVPVGLVTSHWGGTKIEPWTPPQGFDSVPELNSIATRVNSKIAGTKENLAITQKVTDDYQAWLKSFNSAKESGKVLPEPPTYPENLRPYKNHQEPTVLFNRMIYPFVPFAFRGAIWYQGCSNRGDGGMYEQKMQALYNGWKTVFNNPNLQFFFVQLAPYTYNRSARDNKLAEIWEAQEKFANSNGEAVGMAVINDVGNLNDIHPYDKSQVGKRLSLLALKRTYDKKELKADSPLLVKHKIEDGKFILTFKNVEEFKAFPDAKSNNFEIADADGAFVPAKNVIAQGNTITVSDPEVKNPKLLRYMWKETAECSFTNEAGLPLGAFRIGDENAMGEELLKLLTEKNQLVYKYDFTTGTKKDKTKVEYLIDNSADIKPFNRITYFITAKLKNGTNQWCLVSMDAFTKDAKQIGVPTQASGAKFQNNIANMVVKTNVPNVKTGDFAVGNIEFWCNNYNGQNSAKVPNADNTNFDFGDNINSDSAGYGSMQIHNFQNKETVFAYNGFSAGPNADFGIGNAPNKNTDWTFAKNLNNYSEATLYVFVN